MQHRMQTHPLSEELINELLLRAQVGNLATLNPDGTPYVTPVHFVYLNNNIYAHGLPKGQKIDNINRDRKIGFSVYEMYELLLDQSGKPCDTNTKYESVIVTGNASLVSDIESKRMVLNEIVKKYTPHLTNAQLPEGMVRGTAVLEINIAEITGKYYG